MSCTYLEYSTLTTVQPDCHNYRAAARAASPVQSVQLPSDPKETLTDNMITVMNQTRYVCKACLDS